MEFFTPPPCVAIRPLTHSLTPSSHQALSTVQTAAHSFAISLGISSHLHSFLHRRGPSLFSAVQLEYAASSRSAGKQTCAIVRGGGGGLVCRSEWIQTCSFEWCVKSTVLFLAPNPFVHWDFDHVLSSYGRDFMTECVAPVAFCPKGTGSSFLSVTQCWQFNLRYTPGLEYEELYSSMLHPPKS